MNNKPFEIYSYSKSGKIRVDGKYTRMNKENQDCKKSDLYRGIFITADGVGGHNGAKAASNVATLLMYNNICDLDTIIRRDCISDELIMKVLTSHVMRANDDINNLGKSSHLDKCMTTIDAVLIEGNKLYGVHVGDGSVYHIDASNNKIERLTKMDKNIRDFNVSSQAKQNIFSPNQMELIEYRKIQYALGMEDIQVQGYQKAINPKDVIILATDGLTKKVHEKEIFDSLSNENLSEGVKNLLNYCKNPVMRCQDIADINNAGKRLTEEELFNDDTTFIVIRRNDVNGN